MAIVPRLSPRGVDRNLKTGVEPLVASGEFIEYGYDGSDFKIRLGDDDAGESFILEEVDGDDLFKVDSTGLVTLKGGATLDNKTSASNLAIAETNIGLTGITTITGATSIVGARTQTGNVKHIGEWTTRNAADNSMYNEIAASSGHERLMKVAAKVTANDGGYFEAGYFNASTTTTATGGEIRGLESKATVLANMDAGAIASGMLAKVNVSGASAEVSKAIGVDVLIEEESSGTVTEGTGVRVQGGAGVMTYGVDVAGAFDVVPLKLKSGTAAGLAVADLAAQLTSGADADVTGGTGIVGIYLNSSDSSVNLVCKYEGRFKYVALTDAS